MQNAFTNCPQLFDPYDYYEGHAECRPVFGRNGCYYDRVTGDCWEEFDGRAFKEQPDMFVYRLSILNHEPMSKEELEAVELLRLARRLPQALKERWWKQREWSDLRQTYRESRKHCMTSLKRFKEEDAKKAKKNKAKKKK